MRWTWRLSRLLRRRRHEAELDAELQFHFAQLVDEYRREGMSDAEAHMAARRELGDVGSYREEVRDAWRPRRLADAWRTVRFAFRSLARSPGFSALAVITLALGIGVNTAMFMLFNSAVLKPLPYAFGERLDRIDRAMPQNRQGRASPADFLDLRKDPGPYERLAGYVAGDVSLAEPGQAAEVVRALRVTVDLFSMLGIQPELGRDFAAGEAAPGADRVVILSRRAWQNRFGGRRDVVGRTVRVDGVPHVIIGVLPQAFNDWRHLGHVDVFRPLVLDAAAAADRLSANVRILGRRAAGQTPEEAGAFVARFGARLAHDYPAIHAGATWRAVRLTDTTQGENARRMLGMLVGLSAFVLLIACSNLANLLLARTALRSRELAVRSALGASRAQLLSPLIAESLLLALAGGAAALIVSQWVGDYFSYRSMGDNGERVLLTFDWRVFGWAFAAAVGTALAFGLAPALFTLRLNLGDTLKSGGRGASPGRGHQRFRQLLIVAQFALAMVLLAGAGLFSRALDELNHRRAGWSSEHLVTGSIALPAGGYPDAERIRGFQRLALERVRALPGVASASLSSFTPMFDWPETRRYVVEGGERPEPGQEPAALVNSVAPGYFETVDTRLVAGRGFDERDGPDAPRVFIINQSMATALFGDVSPIGRRLARAGGGDAASGEIVGVAADVRSVVPEKPLVVFQLYQPMAQEPRAGFEVEARATGAAPAVIVDGIRRAMAGLDPDLPVRGLQPADATIDRANYQLAVLRDVLSALAALGLGLAVLGIYGIIARTMAQRTHELAIRYALGARVLDVTRLVLAWGLKLALVGAALGLLGAAGVSRILSAGFPGMRMDGPLVLAGTTLLLVAVALLASWIPARRAARIDPIEALRSE